MPLTDEDVDRLAESLASKIKTHVTNSEIVLHNVRLRTPCGLATGRRSRPLPCQTLKYML